MNKRKQNYALKTAGLCLCLVLCSLALCACATPRNLFDRDGGVFVYKEKIQIKLYNPDGLLTTTYTARYSGELVDSLPEGEGLLTVKAVVEDSEDEATATESLNSELPEDGAAADLAQDSNQQANESQNGSEASSDAADEAEESDSGLNTPDQQKNTGWSYKGMFVKGHMEGQGTLAFEDGSIQLGYFYKDQLIKGSCNWKNGDIYEGQLSNGTYNGKGSYSFKNGDKYEGDFVNGQFNGQGSYTFASGATYVGSWSNGLYNGAGVYTTASGKIYDGIFENGVFKG